MIATPLWQRLSAEVETVLESASPLESRSEAAYFFNYSRPFDASHAKAVARQMKETRRGLPDPEAVAAWLLLDQAGLLSDYRSLLADLRIHHDMPTARHFYYATRIREMLDQPRSVSLVADLTVLRRPG